MRSRNLEHTRREILQVAFETFFKNGFQGTSMDVLVEKTSLTKGAFYHQFPTKLELGYAVVDEVLTQLILDRWVTPLSEYTDPRSGILALMRKHIGKAAPGLLKYGCPLNNLVQEMAPIDRGFRIRLRSALALWIDGIEKHLDRAKKSGFMNRNTNTKEAARFIVMSHEGFYGLIKGFQEPQLFKVLIASMRRYLGSL